MLFTSYAFIFAFFPVTLAVYWLLLRFREGLFSKIWLILASFYFFAQGEAWFLPYFIGTVIFNYAAGILLLRGKRAAFRRAVLAVALAENIGLLCWYKYTGFFIRTVNSVFSLKIPALNISLPLGLSFFTFMIAAFLADCYRREIEKADPLGYLLFVSFFPKMIIGPLVRYTEFAPQFSGEKARKFDPGNFQKGFFRFSMGCAKKVLLADPMLNYTGGVFSNLTGTSPLGVWLGLLTNLFAFYFDFSGYTDMAIGLALFFNIELPENFDSPYLARNVRQFWKKWHMTLTRFLYRYIFSRIYKPGRRLAGFCLATAVTFLVSGLWHGAGANYVLWGLAHGAAICLAAAVAVKSTRKYLMPKWLARLLTLAFLVFAAALYVFPGPGAFGHMLARMVYAGYYRGGDAGVKVLKFFSDNAYVIAVLIISAAVMFFGKTAGFLAKECAGKRWWTVLAAGLLAVCLFGLGQAVPFIY